MEESVCGLILGTVPILLEPLRKNILKYVCLGRNSNQVIPEYKSEALPFQPSCSVTTTHFTSVFIMVIYMFTQRLLFTAAEET